jgi:hypothetical protein
MGSLTRGLLALGLALNGCADLQAQDTAQLACPPGMASVPGGRYEPAESDTEVAVAPFCLDLTEVTVDAEEPPRASDQLRGLGDGEAILPDAR